MNYSHVIFDIDGTLVDTERTLVFSLQKTLKDLMGLEKSYDELYPYFGIPSAVVAEMFAYEDLQKFGHEWEKNFLGFSNLMVAFEGVPQMLADVKSAGIVTGIVTSRSHHEIEHDRILHEFIDKFDLIICAGDTERPKPYPDPMFKFIELASEKAGRKVSKEECVYLGDTKHDWESAHGADIDFCLADWRGRGLQGIDAQHRFTSADELRQILDIL
ncbi:MAG: HAD family hydrolase [Bacteroidales bacterium]|nr:HAD family hydrolase [Bacteroidales bacterium]